jgi:hypothetical protein
MGLGLAGLAGGALLGHRIGARKLGPEAAPARQELDVAEKALIESEPEVDEGPPPGPAETAGTIMGGLGGVAPAAYGVSRGLPPAAGIPLMGVGAGLGAVGGGALGERIDRRLAERKEKKKGKSKTSAAYSSALVKIGCGYNFDDLTELEKEAFGQALAAGARGIGSFIGKTVPRLFRAGQKGGAAGLGRAASRSAKQGLGRAVEFTRVNPAAGLALTGGAGLAGGAALS